MPGVHLDIISCILVAQSCTTAELYEGCGEGDDRCFGTNVLQGQVECRGKYKLVKVQDLMKTYNYTPSTAIYIVTLDSFEKLSTVYKYVSPSV